MMENTYEVYEDNGGGISLVVLHDGQPIFVCGGYYERGPADLMDDIAARDDVDEWGAESNYLNDDPWAYENLLEFVWLGGNRVNLIADDAGVYPDAMGAAGKLAFGIDDE